MAFQRLIAHYLEQLHSYNAKQRPVELCDRLLAVDGTAVLFSLTITGDYSRYREISEASRKEVTGAIYGSSIGTYGEGEIIRYSFHSVEREGIITMLRYVPRLLRLGKIFRIFRE